MQKQILKIIVGSQGHGTEDENSDIDYRGVHLIPTSELVGLKYKYKGTSWVEGEEEDQTSYELAEFLHLALQNHPNIVEMFMAEDAYGQSDLGNELLGMFPHIYDSQKAFSSFINYAENRRKNMFNAENKHVALKSAYCHIRVLLNLKYLLRNGSFCLELEGSDLSTLKAIKYGKWTNGSVIDYGEALISDCVNLLVNVPKNVQDVGLVKEFLIDVRKDNWEIESDI